MMMIEYKVYNDTTKEQIRKLINIGNRKAKKTNLKDIRKRNEHRRKVVSKLEALKDEIMKL